VDDQLDAGRARRALERWLNPPHTGKVPWALWIERIRATGPERRFCPRNSRPIFTRRWKMSLAVEVMVGPVDGRRLDEEAVHAMAVVTTRRVEGARHHERPQDDGKSAHSRTSGARRRALAVTTAGGGGTPA